MIWRFQALWSHVVSCTLLPNARSNVVQVTSFIHRMVDTLGASVFPYLPKALEQLLADSEVWERSIWILLFFFRKRILILYLYWWCIILPLIWFLFGLVCLYVFQEDFNPLPPPSLLEPCTCCKNPLYVTEYNILCYKTLENTYIFFCYTNTCC